MRTARSFFPRLPLAPGLAAVLALSVGAACLPRAATAQDEGGEDGVAQQDSGQEDSGAGGQAGDPALGSSTNRPVPRYVSLKTDEGNVRRGPSLEHRIDWVFRHREMPLRVTAEFEHWRRVEDSEGQGGWIYYTMLSGNRTVLVTAPKTELHRTPDAKAQVVAVAEEGVIAELGACKIDWCQISADGIDGWVPKTMIWGVDPKEIRD